MYSTDVYEWDIVFESNEDDNGEACDIHSFNETTYSCMDIWVKTDQMQEVLHPHFEAEAAHGAELEAPFVTMASIIAVALSMSPLFSLLSSDWTLSTFQKTRRDK